jgi:hypothetical protein
VPSPLVDVGLLRHAGIGLGLVGALLALAVFSGAALYFVISRRREPGRERLSVTEGIGPSGSSTIDDSPRR